MRATQQSPPPSLWLDGQNYGSRQAASPKGNSFSSARLSRQLGQRASRRATNRSLWTGSKRWAISWTITYSKGPLGFFTSSVLRRMFPLRWLQLPHLANGHWSNPAASGFSRIGSVSMGRLFSDGPSCPEQPRSALGTQSRGGRRGQVRQIRSKIARLNHEGMRLVFSSRIWPSVISATQASVRSELSVELSKI